MAGRKEPPPLLRFSLPSLPPRFRPPLFYFVLSLLSLLHVYRVSRSPPHICRHPTPEEGTLFRSGAREDHKFPPARYQQSLHDEWRQCSPKKTHSRWPRAPTHPTEENANASLLTMHYYPPLPSLHALSFFCAVNIASLLHLIFRGEGRQGALFSLSTDAAEPKNAFP